MSSKKEDQINLYLNAITTRDPSKRQIKPVDKEAFQLFDDFESGSDEDFVLDSDEESDDNDDAKEESEEAGDDAHEENDESNNDNVDDSEADSGANTVLDNIKQKCEDSEIFDKDIITKCKLETVMICMMCLLDVTYSDNEIIECDGCGVVVHEDCYKICDNVFMSCDDSDASTDPWFCDACLNNIKDPRCELCPVEGGGVFKRTENNRWVHLLCALYTPGVAFNDVENLSEITLSELPLKDWSGKECSICSNPFYAKTGVCISCDAGLCKNYFHVLCAQKEGLLSEPNIEENPDDPYFAQCLQHTDKETAKRRRKCWVAAVNRQKLRMEDWNKNGHFEDVRLHRKLEYFSSLDKKYRELAPTPFVPSHKVPCYLETNPVAVYLFKKKATNLRLPQDILNSYTTSDSKTGTGVPVFSPDFITYFLDREKKIDEMSSEITRLESFHRDMQISEQNTSHQFNKIMAKKESTFQEYKSSLDRLNVFLVIFNNINVLPDVTEQLERIYTKYSVISSSNMLNMNDIGVNETISNSVSTTVNNNGSTKKDSVINECCICKSVGDQHLMIDCDDCSKFFHLNCLDPPLVRMPRKTKLYGWQCSFCGVYSCDESITQEVDLNCPRLLRKLAHVPSRYKDLNSLKTSSKERIIIKNTSKNYESSSPFILLSKCEEVTEEKYESIKVKSNCDVQQYVSCGSDTRSLDGVENFDSMTQEQCSSCVHVSSDEVNVDKVDINRPRQLRTLTNICSRYKRYDSLTVSVNAKNRLLKSSKDFANKRIKTTETKKPIVLLENCKKESKLEKSKMKHDIDSDIQQRRSHRSKKRPMTLLDEFEAQNPAKRRKYSKVKLPPPARDSAKSLPLSKKRRFSSSKRGNISLNFEDKTSNKEHEEKSQKQLITFFPSPAKNETIKNHQEADHIRIGIVAKKPIMYSREVGVGKIKVFEKKPVMIKWHGDQDDVHSERMTETGGGVSQNHSRMSL